ncbi:MAG: Kae1-associated serine/threonine protein kinase [Methanomassiliicoccales archaeon]|nr:MAG: Kae1-associated serine/threonine protein kinase [Methanomassiliicoccales archaeon]
MEVIRRGAEAEIRKDVWMGRDVIVKSRVPKAYRHPDLDSSLRASRTKNEARLIQEARRLGVPTPIIYDVDVIGSEMVMQEVKGPRVKDLLESAEEPERVDLCREIGRLVALLHKGSMTHGDLTTSNMIFSEGRVWFIDFSLGGKNATVEEMGVDLHLLKEAFQSAHSGMLHLFDVILASYSEHFDKAPEVIRKIKDIEDRGRYT